MWKQRPLIYTWLHLFHFVNIQIRAEEFCSGRSSCEHPMPPNRPDALIKVRSCHDCDILVLQAFCNKEPFAFMTFCWRHSSREHSARHCCPILLESASLLSYHGTILALLAVSLALIYWTSLCLGGVARAFGTLLIAGPRDGNSGLCWTIKGCGGGKHGLTPTNLMELLEPNQPSNWQKAVKSSWQFL